MTDPLFASFSLQELEKLNLKAKSKRLISSRISNKNVEEYYREYLNKDSKIKAVTVAFSDLEGRLHMLDYDKKYLLNTKGKLTFDGSSVKGFSNVDSSDLALQLDWRAFYWLPSETFGDGKVLIFANIFMRDGRPHPSDFRHRLSELTDSLYENEKISVLVGPEIEGFLMEGVDAELNFQESKGLKLVSSGGYYHSLPKDKLRLFIDVTAGLQRALGFENEKDHPEVAPSQFELNFQPTEMLIAADQILLYKLISRQVAENMGMTATFLPKPIIGINGTGMHINLSTCKARKNQFYSSRDANNMSKIGYEFIERVLSHAQELSLILNSSVNAYRRLDPNFEAPNQIKSSPSDRTAMIRIPYATNNSARIEVRSVAPDANPYLLLYSLMKVGRGESEHIETDLGERLKTLPSNIYDAIRVFKSSALIKDILGEETALKYVKLKEASAHRCPKELGKTIKRAEVIYHHEVTNQWVWSKF